VFCKVFRLVFWTKIHQIILCEITISNTNLYNHLNHHLDAFTLRNQNLNLDHLLLLNHNHMTGTLVKVIDLDANIYSMKLLRHGVIKDVALVLLVLDLTTALQLQKQLNLVDPPVLIEKHLILLALSMKDRVEHRLNVTLMPMVRLPLIASLHQQWKMQMMMWI
jgi:hypothetical protein